MPCIEPFRTLESERNPEAMVHAGDVPRFAADYLAGSDPRHPYASPLYGDPTGLTPTLIQVGSEEILRDDAVRMAERMQRAQVKRTCHGVTP